MRTCSRPVAQATEETQGRVCRPGNAIGADVQSPLADARKNRIVGLTAKKLIRLGLEGISFEPTGDGSLTLLRPYGALAPADEVAAALAAMEDRSGVVVVGGDAAVDAALRRHGLAVPAGPVGFRGDLARLVLAAQRALGAAKRRTQGLRQRGEDGRLIYRIRSSAQWEIVPWVLSFCGHAKLVAPASWRQAIEQAGAALSARHGSGTEPEDPITLEA